MQYKFDEDPRSTFWVEDNHGNKLALFIRSSISVEGLKFFTDDTSTFQVGAMTRPSGEYIEAHIHKPTFREITGTHEVLFLQTGKIRVDIFNDDKTYLQSIVMNPGDVVLLCEGGHGIEILEEARLIEIKQGPFTEGLDKEKFQHTLPRNLDIEGH